MSKIIFAAALFVAIAAAAPTGELGEEVYEGMWQDFVSEHAKVYHPEQVLKKYSVFKDNVDFILDHNKNHAERLGYTTGINQFADMTSSEFKRTMLGLNALQKKDQSNVEILPEATSDSVDWTTKNAVTPVKNQGQCGSCWAFSTTGSVEGISAITTGKLQSFSEQELVSCAGSYGNQGCNGGLMDDGFKYIEAKGDVLETNYPYTGKTGTCTASKTSSPAVKVTGFKDVATNNEAQLMAAVEKQPVSVAIEADQSGFQFYKSGVFSGTCGTKLDHGVLAVGYGTQGSTAYWKVKNSWGATWGQDGYILLARNVANKAGQCGIAAQPSYPTMGAAPPTPPTPPAPPTPTPPAPPTPTPPGPSGTHYGDPASGCLADEEAVQVQGLAGKFCSPDCKSAACPTDVPSGVTAAPQCALQTTTGDKRCALICSATTDEASLRAGDAACGAATCQPIQGTGICTYGGGPAPPPSPSGDCTIATGLQCAESVEKCISACKQGVASCVECLGASFATCCPCLKKLDPNLPVQCGGAQAAQPEFMTVDTTFVL